MLPDLPDAEQFAGPFDLSPVMGRANPLAAPLRLTVEADRVIGTVVFGRAYEGLPGCVHGGVVAGAFDELMGFVQVYLGVSGMTGRLTTTYRHPTPLETELQLEARVDRIEGRTTFCTGEIRTAAVLCAEAEATFVSPRHAQVTRLFTDAGVDLASRPPDPIGPEGD